MSDDKKPKRGRPRSADRHGEHKLLRVGPELYARLARVAEKGFRPVAWEARAALEAHIAEQEKELSLPAITDAEIIRYTSESKRSK